jgi:hypothetical protein
MSQPPKFSLARFVEANDREALERCQRINHYLRQLTPAVNRHRHMYLLWTDEEWQLWQALCEEFGLFMGQQTGCQATLSNEIQRRDDAGHRERSKRLENRNRLIAQALDAGITDKDEIHRLVLSQAPELLQGNSKRTTELKDGEPVTVSTKKLISAAAMMRLYWRSQK